MAEFPIVATGSSAGGLEALQAFFRAMPADTGAAFVLAAHLDPTQESHLSELLSRCTDMPVEQIEGEVRLEPDHVYVIAPDQELTMRDGVVRPNKPTAPRGHRHPVDSFFRSLAEDQGERAIAVILSGTGANGSLGLRFIKAEGGIVVVQDPDTARFPGMPRSAIGTGLADLVIPPEKMGGALTELFRHPYLYRPAEVATEETPEEELGELLSLVRRETGKDFGSYRKKTLTRRVHRRMGLHRIEKLSDYTAFLRDDESEMNLLVADMTINVTGFFRDPEAWQELGEEVIAPLVRERAGDAPIRAWVPGCSTGEEAYSIAMLIIEEAEAQKKKIDVRIFATDVAAGVLSPARAGAYPSSIDQDVSPERLQRFFDMEEDTYCVKKFIREMITFAPQNLLQDPPFSRLDLIACRNLLIYLEPRTQKQVLALFHFALKEDGHLFLGTAESISGQEELFHTVSKRWRIYRRLGPTRHDIVDFPLVGDHENVQRGGEPRNDPPAPQPRAGEVADRAILDRFAPASGLIDERFRIHHFRGPTGDYLQPPSGEPNYNLISMAREGLATPIRSVVRQVVEQGRESSVDARVRRNGRYAPVQVVVAPLRRQGGERRLLVSFVEVNGPSVRRPAEPVVAAGADGQLQEELDGVREELRLTVEQMEASNEELKASNEEIRSINEELQASNEELETSKEELQSLNEELNTVNSQLEAKLAELEERTADLNNLLNSTDIATLFLDRMLCIRWFTPGMKNLLELRRSDVGRPASHFVQRFTDGDMLEEAQQVLDTLRPAEAEVLSDEGRWFMRRILPYRTTQDQIDGVVMTFTDITDRKRDLEALERSQERLRRVLETEAVGVIFFESEGRIVNSNDVFLRMTGYSRSEVEAGLLDWRKLTPPEWMEASEQQLAVLAETGRLGPYEKEYILKDGSRAWMLFAGRDLGDGTIVEFVIDITGRKHAEQDLELVTHELSHRVKNTLAVVQALATQTNGEIASVEEYREKFLGRLRSLARAHGLLLETQWRGTELGKLVRQELEPYLAGADRDIEIEGDPLRLTSRQALGLSLVLHELGTNAAKYGSLSVPEGQLHVSWSVQTAEAGASVRLLWRETGGPPVEPPERQGFGTKLLDRALAHEIGAETKLDYRSEGLVCEIVFPLENEA